MQITDIVLGLAAGVGIDLSPDGKTAYYVEWSIGELTKVETATGKITTVKTGLNLPEDVKLDWKTGEIFVSERTGSILSIGPGERSQPIATPGGAPHQLALIRQGGKRFLYTVCFDSGRLLRIDIATKATVTITAGLGHPIGLVIDSAHKYAYVTEQDTSSLTRVELATGTTSPVYSGLTSPFYLAWDKTLNAIFCVQRDPANSLIKIHLGPPITSTTIANGLAWRPSGVAPTKDNKLIYISADQKLQVISFNGGPTIKHPKPPFEIYSVQFHLPRAIGSIPLKHQATGTAVAIPEYVKATRNEPAAYISGTLPRIQVVLRKLPGFSPGTYSIGATGNLGGVHRKDVTPVFSGSGLSNPIDFELMWPLPAMVDKPFVSFDWYARKKPAASIPVSIGSTVHKIYLVLATPTAPWNTETPWVEGLELACSWAAGATDTDMAAAGITASYNGSGRVSYDTISGSTFYGGSTFSLSQMIDRMNGGPGLGAKVNCTDSADTVSTLANLLGCDLWQSRMSSALGFALNEVIAIGYGTWAVPFGYGFSYHEVAWKGACTQNENVFDGCLKVDGDADPTTAPHSPLLPTNMLFGACGSLDYRLRLCPPTSDGCANCVPQPGTTRRRRPIN